MNDNPIKNVSIDLHAGMLPSSDAIKYKLLFCLSLIVLIALIAFLGVEYFLNGFQRETVVVVKTTETAAYDLFDKQFSHLLTVLSLLFVTFGLVIPFVTFFFQRATLKDERIRMMTDVASHEKQLIERVESLKVIVDEMSETLKGEFASQIAGVKSNLQSFHCEKDAFEMALSYRLGEQFFISGTAFSEDKLACVMSWIYALEQFSKYPGYKNSMQKIDSTLANIFGIVADRKKSSPLGIRWSYRLEAIKILRQTSENTSIKSYLRNAARDIAKAIAKIKEPQEKLQYSVTLAPGQIKPQS